MIDLHSHTTESDGELSAEALVERAHQAGVRTLAVTDHDTVQGLPAAAAAAQARGIRLVPGIELSAFLLGREVHVLGHFLQPDDPALRLHADRLRAERTGRMEAMVQRMRELGFPITMEAVRAVAGSANLGRPHLARVLVDRGWCRDLNEAFDRFLGEGKPANVQRYKLTAEDAVALVHAAGGTATLAHPGSSKLDRYEITALKRAGLDGLEVLHSEHHPGQREKFLRIADDLDLVPTAGSDFHGPRSTPRAQLGKPGMPEAQFERLRARARAPVVL